METFLHVALFLLLLAAWRIGVLWFRPFKQHSRCKGRGCKRCSGGQRLRLGARRVQRARQNLTAALSARIGGDEP